VNLHQDAAEILNERWERMPVHRRPHYTPELRFRILRIKQVMGLSCEETGRRFGVAAWTVGRWEKDLLGDPSKKTIGKLVRPKPPIRRYADVVREVVHAMTLTNFGGNRMVAAILARVGWKLSKTTVARYRKEPAPAPRPETAGPHTVVARYLNHVWMSDITQLPGLFGLTRFHIASIFDVVSRMPLVTRSCDSTPTGKEITALFREAVRLHGKPKHFVSDQGDQYRSGAFKTALRRLGTQHRFGAVLKHGSIALIERLWLSLKVTLSRFPFAQPLLWEDLDQSLHYTLTHYAFHRPHSALGGATPAEVYYERSPACWTAEHPPRGKPGQYVPRPAFRMTYLDPERRLPILVKAA
jgi:transposase InsO family protein